MSSPGACLSKLGSFLILMVFRIAHPRFSTSIICCIIQGEESVRRHMSSPGACLSKLGSFLILMVFRIAHSRFST
ncbi:hypothetical protein B0O80DRAFT_467053 [Mortierella sp. GBAus27b]|nr:hypothetical protein B0O80DRAFT_467039 [Mortierella sp. GBAus27b]KAI8346726.1 hypothetical protein B0O80DRAFT_467053 [Mortierella sp. GBAus27b]